MEEILASIRRIIADDDSAKSAAADSVRHGRESPHAATRPAMLPPRTMPSSRPAVAPQPAMQEEIDKMLARLHAASTRSPSAPADEPVAEGFDEMEETEEAEQATAAAAGVRTVGAQSDAEFDDGPCEPSAPPRPAPEPRREPDDTGDDALISAATTAAVDAAFNALAQSVPVQNGRTLEELVRELLRPMLKAWLDDNLPRMVDRLVRAEIERVSRGRG
jgi:cell pole-organizing protein PopZ